MGGGCYCSLDGQTVRKPNRSYRLVGDLLLLSLVLCKSVSSKLLLLLLFFFFFFLRGGGGGVCFSYSDLTVR